MAGKPKVDPHPLVKALTPDPSKPPQRTLKLYGLPGASPTAGETRLWLDSELTSYVDVPDDGILYSKTLPDDAGTILWVATDARLTYGSVTSHATQAGFLAGDITATHLAAAGAGVPQVPLPTPPVTLVSACGPCVSQLGQCPSLPLCPSEVGPVSQCTPCPSHLPCPSLPACPSEACPPTHLVPCATHPPLCPILTSPVVCHISAALPCPTHPPQCPILSSPVVCRISVQIPCVTQPPVCHPPTAVCPSHTICPTPTATLQCPSALVACPSRLCPSSAIPCQTGPVCPSGFCPVSAACNPGGQGGPAQ